MSVYSYNIMNKLKRKNILDATICCYKISWQKVYRLTFSKILAIVLCLNVIVDYQIPKYGNYTQSDHPSKKNGYIFIDLMNLATTNA